MSARRETFEALYARDLDPWGFATSAYEREKYDATLAALPAGRIGSALELGCSIGVLSARLAERCDRLLGIDLSERALDAARARCAGQSQVAFRRLEIPAAWPEGRFDLVLVSELLYFLSADEVRETARRVAEALAPAGLVLLVNYLGPTETALDGDAAAECFLAAWPGPAGPARRTPGYRLDTLRSG